MKYILENDINIYSGADSQRRSGVLEAGTVVEYNDTPVSESGKVEIITNPDKPLSEGEKYKVAYCNYVDLKVLTACDEVCVEISKEVSQNDEVAVEETTSEEVESSQEDVDCSINNDEEVKEAVVSSDEVKRDPLVGIPVKIKRNVSFDINGNLVPSSLVGSILYIKNRNNDIVELSESKEGKAVCKLKINQTVLSRGF